MVTRTAHIKGAWVIVLTSINNYVKGVIALAGRLRKSQYPFVILHTPAVAESVQRLLQGVGCHLKPIDAIRSPGRTHYHFRRFVETWTKLAVWNLPEFDQVVLIDADILPIQNIDGLMPILLKDEHHIATCHAYTCSPQNIEPYPANWYLN